MQACTQKYPITEYQPVYFVTENLDVLKDSMANFCDSLKRWPHALSSPPSAYQPACAPHTDCLWPRTGHFTRATTRCGAASRWTAPSRDGPRPPRCTCRPRVRQAQTRQNLWHRDMAINCAMCQGSVALSRSTAPLCLQASASTSSKGKPTKRQAHRCKRARGSRVHFQSTKFNTK